MLSSLNIIFYHFEHVYMILLTEIKTDQHNAFCSFYMQLKKEVTHPLKSMLCYLYHFMTLIIYFQLWNNTEMHSIFKNLTIITEWSSLRTECCLNRKTTYLLKEYPLTKSQLLYFWPHLMSQVFFWTGNKSVQKTNKNVCW